MSSPGLRTPSAARLAPRTLILNREAGSMTLELVARLEQRFDDHLIVEFDPAADIRELVVDEAPVVVAGGDGTVGHVARRLVDSGHPLGVLAVGTYNNFARAVGVPEDIDQAIEVVRAGTPRPVRIGRVNGKPFLEAAAIGMFGAAIELGQDVKELRFGELGEHLRRLLALRPFHYRLSGDLSTEGTTLSLVFANTPTSGADLAIGEGSPTDPYLQLCEQVGESRHDLAGRLADSALLHRHELHGTVQRFRRLRVETYPLEPVLSTDAVRVYGDDSEMGQTPVVIEAELGGLHVILP